MGHIAVGAFMFGMGGLLMSRNFTIQRGDFRFSTDDDAHSLARLQQHYADRVRHMRENSATALEQLESGALTDSAKVTITKEVVGCYMSPTSHDELYGKDIVIYNGKGKPTILLREEWDDVASNWRRALVIAGMKDCVDTHRLETEYSAHHAPAATDAWKCCMEKCAFLK